MKNRKPIKLRYIVKIKDYLGVSYLTSMVVDAFPGETWPPHTMNSFHHDRNSALRFYRKKVALKAAKMLQFKCGCGKCDFIASVERI